MKIIKSSIPSVSGFYFVKTKNSNHWQLLVRVIGVKPFMSIETINPIFRVSDDKILSNLSDLDWSRKIEMMIYDPIVDTIEGFVVSTKLKNELTQLVKANQNLLAVKTLREASRNGDWSLGLKECKDYCEKLIV